MPNEKKLKDSSGIEEKNIPPSYPTLFCHSYYWHICCCCCYYNIYTDSSGAAYEKRKCLFLQRQVHQVPR